jgi:hypothetical protein
MQITSQIVADQIAAYLHHQLSLKNLVDWAERQVMDADFQSPVVRNAVARLGLADVRAFGLAWEDCQNLLDSLGFAARVEIVAAK